MTQSDLGGVLVLTLPRRSGVIAAMLGRLQRTTRLDVGLALCFSGLAYLVWALVAGISRWIVQEMIKSTAYYNIEVKGYTKVVEVFFVDSGFVIDIVGMAWMALSLLLVVLSSRQRASISWAWVSSGLQVCVAAVGAVLVCAAAYMPHILDPNKLHDGGSIGQQVSRMSLQVVMPLAIVIWVTFLVWLLVERARLNRRGPTLRDGMRSNVYR